MAIAKTSMTDQFDDHLCWIHICGEAGRIVEYDCSWNISESGVKDGSGEMFLIL